MVLVLVVPFSVAAVLAEAGAGEGNSRIVKDWREESESRWKGPELGVGPEQSVSWWELGESDWIRPSKVWVCGGASWTRILQRRRTSARKAGVNDGAEVRFGKNGGRPGRQGMCMYFAPIQRCRATSSDTCCVPALLFGCTRGVATATRPLVLDRLLSAIEPLLPRRFSL